MTGGPTDSPFVWNVAGLLGDEPGASRRYTIEDAWGDGHDLGEPLAGVVTLRRTNRGVLAEATLTGALGAECSRCLRAFAMPLKLEIEEEYLPSIDLKTGNPLSTADEPDVLRLTDHHELDLETPVDEAIILAVPIAPVCRPDCPGLCVVCGERLDDGPHDHPDDDIDPRMEALRAFRTEDA